MKRRRLERNLDFQIKKVTGCVLKEQLEHGCDAGFLNTEACCLSAADVRDMDNISIIPQNDVE